MSKKQRLQDIINLINTKEVDTQDEITDALNELGYNVSQATVSRDIKELGIIKIAGNVKKFKYSLADNVKEEISPKIIELYKHVTLSVVEANNLIVVKTLSGNAGAAGMAIDQMKFNRIIGTVAGDDTLLIITKTDADAEIIAKSLRML
ncbi:MAG: arginine repressor [Clostridia bacterium]|nr:arginine repressor [Clostridia bacterium]